MEGFCAITYSGGTQTDIFQKTHNLLSILGGYSLSTGEILVADIADGLPAASHYGIRREIFLGGHGDHQTAGNVLSQTDNLIGEAGNVLFTDVGQQ